MLVCGESLGGHTELPGNQVEEQTVYFMHASVVASFLQRAFYFVLSNLENFKK